MRKLIPLCIVLALAGCQKQNLVVPTTDELMNNTQLRSEWKAKCDTGEYSHLPADQKNNVCFTMQEAARSMAIKKTHGI